MGKALNDPVKNLTALSRAGIQFSKEQTSTIKHLAETNRLAEAQGLILEELERQYGGQAEAAAKVGHGALQQLKNSWGDFLEQIGATLMPVVTKIAGALSQVVAVLQNMNPQMREVIVIVAGIAAAIGPLAFGIGGIIKMLPMLAAGFTALLSPVGLVVAAVLALGAAFFYAYQRKKELQEDMTTQFEGLSLGTLEKRLKENKRLQEVNERESPWQGNSPYSKLTYALNKGKRRDTLKMEEEALTEAIRRNTQAYEERQRVEAESKKIADDMANAMKGVNVETTRGSGLINDLTTKIEVLEKKKLLPNATVEDIAAANSEIGKLKEELNRLQNFTPEQLNRKPLEPIAPIGASLIVPKLEVKLPDMKPIITKAQQQMMEIRNTVTEGIYGWAEVTSSGLQSSIMETEAIVGKYTEALVAKGWKFSEALTFVSDKVSEVMKGFDESMSRFLAGSIEAAAEAIGQIIAGDLGFDGLMKAILLQLASFLKQIGAQLIEFGIMIIAFKTALKSVLANPWAAIAIGTAMVAAAAVMTALINKSTIDNTNVTYTWQKLGSGTWTTITSANAEGITGYTTNEITIPESAVLNFESFKCVIKDTDAASGTYNTSVSDIISFADMSDPYQVEITTPQGTTLTSGLTSTTLTVQCWQNGALLADSFFTGATCKWRKFNKLGVQDTSWGTSGIKTGRSITVTSDEVSVAATFTVEIEK